MHKVLSQLETIWRSHQQQFLLQYSAVVSIGPTYFQTRTLVFTLNANTVKFHNSIFQVSDAITLTKADRAKQLPQHLLPVLEIFPTTVGAMVTHKYR